MDFLHPRWELDILGRYSKITPYLKTFLKGKDLATKIIGPNFTLLKRWTVLPFLHLQDLDIIDENYLQLRANHHLDDVRKQLNPKQTLVRQYFFPRKLVNFFYACNNEYGKDIERVFIDIDRQTNTADDARKVALELVNTIKTDRSFPLKHKTIILRTWASFHVYLILAKPIDHKFYDTYLSYGKKKEKSFINKRAETISKKIWLTVLWWHARIKNALILDTSNTPPGKLARVPFSLHIKDSKTVDGICVPVTEAELADPKLISKLQKLTPEEVWKNINWYGKLLN